MNKPLIIVLALLLSALSLNTQAQPRIAEWTEAAGELGLGFPVPIPVDTPLPFDGFRSFNGLHTRHQDLMNTTDWIHGEVVGTSHEGMDIWAYRVGDGDSDASAGREIHEVETG